MDASSYIWWWPSAIALSIALFCVWLDRRLFGDKYSAALRASALMAFRSRWFGVMKSLIVAMVLGFLFLPAYRSAGWQLWLGVITVVINITFIFVRPPIAVVLAASSSQAARFAAQQLRRSCGGHRVAYCLRPNLALRTLNFDISMHDMGDNLYQKDDALWKARLYPLLRLAPIIVIDFSEASGGLHDELRFVATNPDIVERTVVLAKSNEPYELERLGAKFKIISDLNELESAVGDIMVRRRVEQALRT